MAVIRTAINRARGPFRLQGQHVSIGGGAGGRGAGKHALRASRYFFPLIISSEQIVLKKTGDKPDSPKFCVKSLFVSNFRRPAMLLLRPAFEA